MAALGPDTRNFSDEAVRTHADSFSARGKARRGGTAFHKLQTSPPALLRSSAAARRAPGSSSHPRPPTPAARARRPAHAHPGPGPSALLELGAVPRCLWERRERPHKAKGAQRRRGRGQGPVDSPGGGVDTKRAEKAPGGARGLQAQPRSRLRSPPLPFLGSRSLSVQFPSPPPLRPSPLRRGERSWGLGERREGKGEGKGRGGGERRTSPSKTGVEFQLWTLGPNCTPPPGLSPRCLLLPDDAATLRVVWSAPSWKPLSPSRPRAPPPAPLCLPFISPTSVFPVGGSALLPPSLGPQRSLSPPLAFPL